MRTMLLSCLCALGLAADAAAVTVPVPDPVLGTWRVTSTGTDTYPTVFGSILVTGGPDSFIGTTQERTFLMGDATCALAAGRQVWSLHRVGWQSGTTTSVRYEGTSVQPYGDSSIGCPDRAFDAWWIVSLTDGRMSFSMPIWNRSHGLRRVDTTPPRADAQPGSVAPGRASSLNVATAEESGWAHFTARVLRGSHVLMSRSWSHVFATSSGETQTLMWTPSRSVTGPLRLCASAVDGSGNRSAESCATIAVRGADRAAPRIDVQRASGPASGRIRLRWRMGDDSGTLRITVAVHRPDGTLAAVKTYPAVSAQLPWESHHIWFTAPAAPGTYRFCVTVRDAAGHRARDCAPLVLRAARAVAASNAGIRATITRYTAQLLAVVGKLDPQNRASVAKAAARMVAISRRAGKAIRRQKPSSAAGRRARTLAIKGFAQFAAAGRDLRASAKAEPAAGERLIGLAAAHMTKAQSLLLRAKALLGGARATRAALDDVVVAAGGRIGPVEGHVFRIGRTTEQAVLRVEGRPDGGKAAKVIGGNGRVVGRDLTYTLRVSKRSTCYRTYQFTSQRGKTLQDFRSNCPHLKTEHGTRVGMAAARAIANEGVEPSNPPAPFGQTDNCALMDAWGISVPAGGNRLVVWLKTKSFFDPAPPDYRNVADVAVYGPRSVSLAATCKGARARPAAETAPKPGEWRGSTREGRLVVFDVRRTKAGNYVVEHFNTDSRFTCSNRTTRLGSFYDLGAPIRRGRFAIDRANPPSMPAWTQHVRGVFDAKRHVSGTVRGTLTDLVDHSITCRSPTVHWTAKVR